MNSKDIIHSIRVYLSRQLNDDDLADELARAVHDCLLDWTAPTTDLANVGAIIALSFGYRRLPNGNIVPGPMNQLLADMAVDLYAKLRCRTYAQWEVAEAIGTRIPSVDVHTINPDISPKDGTVQYLSTVGVMRNIQESVTDPKSLGKVLIVAWRHHAPRCVKIARRYGFEAYVPPEPLPSNYDLESGQAWTRTPRAYVLHDGLARLEAYRVEVIGTSSPSSQLD